jgi:replication factor C subunit 1
MPAAKMQENYLNHRPGMASNENTAMQVIAKAADAFSAGDAVNKRVRVKQEWSLMPYAAVMGAVYPASYMRCAMLECHEMLLNMPCRLHAL